MRLILVLVLGCSTLHKKISPLFIHQILFEHLLCARILLLTGKNNMQSVEELDYGTPNSSRVSGNKIEVFTGGGEA